MSNIEKIRQEIKRLKKLLEVSTYYLDNSQQALGYSFALDDLEDFIDSLPDEEPKHKSNPLFNKCVENCDPETMAEVNRNVDKMLLDEELERFIASGKSVTVEDCGTYKVSYHDFKKVARHFAEWQKEQMLKDAVDGSVAQDIYSRNLVAKTKDLSKYNLKFGDKIKLIIVKE